ncbi:MAG TPA: toxin-antitoxin system HicB family antitoxin [Gaiellaceae bacterium]|jgi:hypothetical protein|nr:toxin-antitoxin system HicB family antitoxin [Gaiellaceae bacterium]
MEAAEVPEGRGSGGSAPRRSGRSGSHSGRLLLRMPEGLHTALAHESEREGTSLNALITGLLADAVGWHPDGVRARRTPPRGRRDPSVPASGPSRLVARLLVANLVVVGVVGIVAVVLLVQALR